jgi:ubiquinol-cytochrome c reductase cytochrome c1 subunit
MAKDVTNFLSWAAEPEHDERKKIGIKAVILFSALTALSIYVKRFKWNVIKNRKIGESRNVMLIANRLAECPLVYNPPVDKTH